MEPIQLGFVMLRIAFFIFFSKNYSSLHRKSMILIDLSGGHY